MSNKYTREWWKERLHLIQAFADGKIVENASADRAKWYVGTMLSFISSPDYYRIAPEQKLRPWNLNEVPLGAWICRAGDQKHENEYGVITVYVDYGGVPIPCGKENSWLDFETLMDDYVHSTDGGKTWHPCGMMEEQP